MNTNDDVMRHRCPDARLIGVGDLPQHRLCFRYHADVVIDCNTSTYGVVWCVSDRDLEQLDWAEGYPNYYERKTALIAIDTLLTEAWVYVMKDRHPLELPDDGYYALCKQGYQQHGVDLTQMETAMYFIKNKPKTVGEAVRMWGEKHGKADVRFYIDQHFWSYSLNLSKQHNDINEIESWCDTVLGQDNWHRVFEKFWFTSEQDFVMFKLTWNRNDHND